MPKQECKKCKYLKKDFFRQDFLCNHKEIYACANRYEKEKKKKIRKVRNFIGHKLPKSCLRWCPLMYLENDLNAINAGEKEQWNLQSTELQKNK